MNVQLPAVGFLRQLHILGDLSADPPILPILPLQKSKFRADIQAGLFVPPVKLGARASGWLTSEVRALCDAIAAGATDDDRRALVRRLIAARHDRQ